MHGPFTVGTARCGVDSIGPEFGFGHTVGNAIDAPVVLIKIAWGGKSLAVDFRPPSAAPTNDEVAEVASINDMLALPLGWNVHKLPSRVLRAICAGGSHRHQVTTGRSVAVIYRSTIAGLTVTKVPLDAGSVGIA